MDDYKGLQFSPLTGFMPEQPPLTRLPDYFNPWETLIDKLPELLKTKQLRQHVDTNLPLLIVSDNVLPTERHWNRASKILTFLSQGYIWQNGDEGVPVLPRQLAIPWWEVSNRLGLPPVATYASVLLWNWKLKDPANNKVTFDNIEIETLFTGTHDEDWFYKVSVDVDLAAIKGILQGIKCLDELRNAGDINTIIECLKVINISIQDMSTSLQSMYEQCSTSVFYEDLRIFFAGSIFLRSFSNGIIFDGVSPEPKGYPGANASQSSSIPALDIILGVEHTGTVKESLDKHRWHMPRPHRQFLLSLTLKPSLRTFVLNNKTNYDLVKEYNNCIESLAEFRNKHIVMVTRYLVTPANRDNQEHDDGSLATRGTGGAKFMVFLKSSRDETMKCHIK